MKYLFIISLSVALVSFVGVAVCNAILAGYCSEEGGLYVKTLHDYECIHTIAPSESEELLKQ